MSRVLVSSSLPPTFAEPVLSSSFSAADEDLMNIAGVLSHDALITPFLLCPSSLLSFLVRPDVFALAAGYFSTPIKVLGTRTEIALKDQQRRVPGPGRGLMVSR